MQKKIVILASTLGKEGTSRFVTYLANYLSLNQNYCVKLLFFRTVNDELLSQFNENVEIKSLGLRNKLWLSAFSIMKHIIHIRPNYCILAYHQLLWFSFLVPLLHVFCVKLYLRDTIIPSLFHKNISRFDRRLNVCAYRLYDKIICQSFDMYMDLLNNWGCFPKKMQIINNPVDVNKINSSLLSCPIELKEKSMFTFVAAGRLVDQKGYDIIIDRMYEIKSQLNFQLFILGTGELETLLQKKITELGLGNNIKLLGYRKDVFSFIYFSDALLLSSRYEGFPNIVLEAQSLGKPVFSNNCLGGINEILKDDHTGIYCDFEDSKSFQIGLNTFFSKQFDEDLIRKITREKYDITHIMPQYMSLFN